uniref:Retrotransposon gag domain-containing protein n=1 Tax=Amphimedon queenslandica TaxID=400682 RepID=A0A1X7TE33_AMPQE
MEEQGQEIERGEEERQRYEELRQKEEDRRQEREEDHLRYEELIRSLTEKKKDVGPETLKLTKLGELDDIKAFLTAFERAVNAHNVDQKDWAAMLAPQLTGKALKAYAAMANADAKDYMKVKEAIFRRYDINEETYRQRFRSAHIKRTDTVGDADMDYRPCR